eukprot:g3423.t1
MQALPSPVKEGTGGTAKADYLDTKRLQAFKCSDDSEAKVVFGDACSLIAVKANTWTLRFDSLNKIRAIVIFHCGIFEDNEDTVKRLLETISFGINDLRSALARNALLLSQDAFRSLGNQKLFCRHMSSIMPSLLQRTLEKSFLGQDSTKALHLMVFHCTLRKVCQHFVDTYIHYKGKKNTKFTGMLCKNCLGLIAKRVQEEEKNGDATRNHRSLITVHNFGGNSRDTKGISLLGVAAEVLKHKLPEARESAKQYISCVKVLFDSEIQSLLNKTHLSDGEVRAISKEIQRKNGYSNTQPTKQFYKSPQRRRKVVTNSSAVTSTPNRIVPEPTTPSTVNTLFEPQAAFRSTSKTRKKKQTHVENPNPTRSKVQERDPLRLMESRKNAAVRASQEIKRRKEKLREMENEKVMLEENRRKQKEEFERQHRRRTQKMASAARRRQQKRNEDIEKMKEVEDLYSLPDMPTPSPSKAKVSVQRNHATGNNYKMRPRRKVQRKKKTSPIQSTITSPLKASRSIMTNGVPQKKMVKAKQVVKTKPDPSLDVEKQLKERPSNHIAKAQRKYITHSTRSTKDADSLDFHLVNEISSFHIGSYGEFINDDAREESSNESKKRARFVKSDTNQSKKHDGSNNVPRLNLGRVDLNDPQPRLMKYTQSASINDVISNYPESPLAKQIKVTQGRQNRRSPLKMNQDNRRNKGGRVRDRATNSGQVQKPRRRVRRDGKRASPRNKVHGNDYSHETRERNFYNEKRRRSNVMTPYTALEKKLYSVSMITHY